MKDGICPKCSSERVYTDENKTYPANIHYRNLLTLGGFLRSGALIDNYVCVNCGYIESYVHDREKLYEIINRWRRVK